MLFFSSVNVINGNFWFIYSDQSISKVLINLKWFNCFNVRFSFYHNRLNKHRFFSTMGRSGGAMVLVNFPVPGVLLNWIIVGQGPIALALGAGGACLDIFSLICHFALPSPSLWEAVRYRLQYCLKGLLNQKQQPNQIFSTIQYILVRLLKLNDKKDELIFIC